MASDKPISCLQKKLYTSGDTARRKAEVLTKLLRKPHKHYRCPNCQGYHLTTTGDRGDPL